MRGVRNNSNQLPEPNKIKIERSNTLQKKELILQLIRMI